jgi:tetratricopeptide (TPR) repeat protein
MWRAGQVRLTVLSALVLAARFCFAESITPLSLDPYALGVMSLKNGDFAGAESRFQEALTSGSNDVRLRSLFGLADLELRKGQPQEVEKYLRQAQSTAPQEPAVYRAWGRYLAIQKRFPEAEKSFQRAVVLSHRDVGSQMDLGDFYLLGPRRFKEATGAYRAVLAKNPNHAGAHYALGIALTRLGQNAEAETQLQDASRLAPTLPFAPQALGELYLHRRQYDKALETFSGVVKLRADFVPAHVGLGDAWWGKEDASKAAAEYAKAAKLAPNEASLQIKLGMLDEWFGKPQEAEQAYLAAVRLDPKAAVAYNNLAWMTVEGNTLGTSKLDQAEKWAQTAVDLDPRIPAFQVTLAWAYRARGELDKATSVLEKSADANPQSPEVLYRLGVVYSEAGKTRQAAAYLAKALAVETDAREADDIRKRLGALGRGPTTQPAPHP